MQTSGFIDQVQSICASGSRAAKSLSILFNPVDQDMQSRIDDITDRLQDIQTQIQYLGLSAANIMQQQTLQTETLRSQRESTSIVSEVFGRDEKKQEIITQLLKDEQSCKNYVVIPIVGKGGIGKTTLAQYVYNDEQQLKGHFDFKAWVCVSDVFDVKRVTTAIINSATKQNLSFSNLEQAQVQLREVLNGKKFLIVLDDVWTDNYNNDWDKLQAPFGHIAKGSRVVMTTRIMNIARMMINNPTQCNILEGLSDDDCWRLFQQHANDGSDFAEMRVDIIEKCKGLPLVAKALGGLLKSTVDERQRQMILDSNIWSEQSNVLPVLRLSYLHLPSHLKRIFAYCSVFPKKFRFKEEYLVHLWMAQGFLPENKRERMEDIGHHYFLDLVSRSLFERSPSREERFIMHDLIHDLAQWAAGDVCCATKTINMDMQRDLKRTRHLFLTKDSIDETLGIQLRAPQLLTFLYPAYFDRDGMNIEILDYVQRFQYLGTLLLASRIIEELPECIGDLKHLRLLKLFLIKIKVLPNSSSKLCNLQTLALHGCENLEEVPNISFMVKLRHLNIDGTSLWQMPLGIGRLTNLQGLDRFVLGNGGGSRLRELRNLSHLHGSLKITGIGHVSKVEHAKEAQLHVKEGLDELYLHCGPCRDEVDDNIKSGVLEQLKPYISIRVCGLYGYMGLTFPGWLGDPAFINMVAIKLVNCEKCKCLPPLGQLPSLKHLWVEGLDGIKEIGPEFYGHCSNTFPALRTLYFVRMESSEKWLHSPVDNNRAFPCLEQLNIEDCVSLQGDLPPHLLSLKTLEIKNCKEMSVSLPSLPLLEELRVEGCKVLSTTAADVMFCSKRMVLGDILEMIDLPGHFPYLCEDISINNCLSPPITFDQIPVALRRMLIYNCREVQSLEFEDSSSSTSHLEHLIVQNCESIISIGHIPWTLQLLEIKECQKLRFVEFKELPCSSSVGLAQGVERLHFWNCENMESLPSQFHNFTSLQELYILKCPKIHTFPKGGLPRNLTFLWIEQVNIKQPVQEWGLHLLHSLDFLQLENVGSSVESAECIPSPDLSLPTSLSKLKIKGFHNLKTISCNSTTLPNLTKLELTDCAKLESLDNSPEGCLPRNLTSLTVRGANIDKPIQEWGLHLLTSLVELTLENVGSSTDSVDCIIDLHVPSSLSILSIKGFQNLKTICCSTLPSLIYIRIRSCPKFESFGDNGLPPLLQSVSIEECDFIKQHLISDPDGRIDSDNGTYSLR